MKTKINNFIYLFFLLYFVSCNSTGKQDESTHESIPSDAIEINELQYKTAGIQLGTISDKKIHSTLKVNGTVSATPGNMASVSAPLGGFVKSTSLVQGLAVVKGQVLARIENFIFIELQQNFLETRAKFQYAEIEFKRHSELFRDNVYSEKNVQQTETEFKTLKAQLMALEQKLQSLGIDPAQLTEDRITGILPLVAPISGFVKSVNLNIGKFVNPSDVLCEIVNPKEVILELVVFEKDILKVEEGQEVIFSTPDEPEKVFNARVYQAGKVLDNDKTAMVYAGIEKTEAKLLAGMFVNAVILTGSRETLAVPQAAVVRFNEQSFIFIHYGSHQEKGKLIYDFKAIPVSVGDSGEGFYSITLPQGLPSTGLKVVVKGAYDLLSAWKNSGEMAC